MNNKLSTYDMDLIGICEKEPTKIEYDIYCLRPYCSNKNEGLYLGSSTKRTGHVCPECKESTFISLVNEKNQAE